MTHRVNLIAGKRSAADASVRHFEPYSPHRFALARRAARWVWLPLVLTVAMSAQARAVAPEVKDGGGFFTPETITKANAQLAEIEKKYKKDFLIETFATVPADKAEAVKGMDKDARKRFFQAWAKERAKAVGVNGIY